MFKHTIAVAVLMVLFKNCVYVPVYADDVNDSDSTASVLIPKVLEARTEDLPAMRARGFVRALVTPSRSDFFIDQGTPRGIQADLLKEYEAYLNEGRSDDQQKMHVVHVPVSFDELLPALQSGRGDIAAALLTLTPERERDVTFVSGGRLKVAEVVVTHKDSLGLRTIEDLAGQTVYVLRASSYVTHLRELNERMLAQGLDPMDIIEADPNLHSEDILELVNAGVVTVTVVDDYKARLWAQVLPDITVHEDIAIHGDGTVGWVVRKTNPRLAQHLSDFAETVKKGTLLGNILFKRYFENTQWIDNPLAESERQKLADVTALFQKYGDAYGFDYLAVAAQAYQESGLDHSVRSDRGAVGIMQLLPSTAADPNVGIPDIESLENNIHAGVKYLAFLRERYFSDPAIQPHDQVAFAWAAYNAGPAKIAKVRQRASELGLDANRWFNHCERAAFEMVGKEPINYVANIYKYFTAYRLAADKAT